MAVMAGMDDVWVRIGRAKERQHALNDAISTFRREHPENETVGFDHDGKGNLRLLARIAERPPRDWGMAVGDLLVDLRCALDYAVYALAVAGAGKPVPDFDSKLEFPICVDEAGWKSAIGRKRLHGVAPKAIDYIRSLQEFGGGGNALMALEELVGVNKHRFIYVAFHKLDSTRIKIAFDGFEPITADVKHIPGELEDGAELLTLHLRPAQQRAEVHIEASLQTSIVIEPTSKGWIRIDDFLPKIGAWTEHIAAQLEGFLSPDHEAPPGPIALVPWGWVVDPVT